jgi:D-beta-D-heptose 7-phosphate kinase/D-beta-D-heptose 1-phosphate adenosyltransferase
MIHYDISRDDARAFLGKAASLRILVIGDLILDHFVTGTVRRISPEAPVPVVEVKKETHRAGGAGNVCLNISALGASATVSGIIGDDAQGALLRSILNENGVADFLIVRKQYPTTLKTRVVAGVQQMVRIDYERLEKLSRGELRKLRIYLERNLEHFDAVVISDYGKGMIIPSLIKTVVNLCRRRKIVVTVDPKIDHFFYYKNVTCLTPNTLEASLGMRMPEPDSSARLIALGKLIRRKLRADYLVITQGKDGMTVFSKKQWYHLPAISKEVFDVTGAGDTVIAVITLGLAAGLDILKSAVLANYSAGVVVQKLGTATVSPEELLAMVENRQKDKKYG